MYITEFKGVLYYHLYSIRIYGVLIYLRFPCEIDEKVSIFVEKLKKMKPPKMTFRSQIEPSIKSYECFMFLVNFRL